MFALNSVLPEHWYFVEEAIGETGGEGRGAELQQSHLAMLHDGHCLGMNHYILS